MFMLSTELITEKKYQWSKRTRCTIYKEYLLETKSILMFIRKSVKWNQYQKRGQARLNIIYNLDKSLHGYYFLELSKM